MSRENERREERYRKGKAAEAEVLRRIGLAVDRLGVALSSEGGNIAQALHAIHYIERGWADDSRTAPRDAPYLHWDRRSAEELTLALAQMLTLARNSRYTVDEADQ